MAFWRSRVRSASGPPFISLLLAATFGTSLALLLFGLFTVEHHYVVADGPDVFAYGFPVPWHRANGAISMAREIDPRAALFDFVLYAVPLLLVTVNLHRLLWRRRRVVAFLMGIVFLAGAFGVLSAVGLDKGFAPIAPTVEQTTARSARLHVGWGFR